MSIIGIDLGTTNSACAVWQEGQSVLIPNRLGKLLTPSVVSIDEQDKILVGEAAKQRLITHPKQTAATFKRFMGSDKSLRLGKKSFTAPELSSLVLRSLKEDAEAYLGSEVKEAVISVPAYFNDIQRKATKLAGELAGLKVDRLVNEPTAAAIAFGLHEKPGSHFIVIDLGGGTFDVSIVEYFEGVLEVHSSSGDNYLGGEDFLSHLVNRFLQDNSKNINQLNAGETQRVLDAMEQVKIQFTNETHIKLTSVVEWQKEEWTFSREEFEDICQPLLKRLQTPIERSIRDANIELEDIDEVVLVGGATRMHMVKSLISRMFRRIPYTNIDPDLVVASGAGIQAGLVAKNVHLDDVVLTDVCPYTLGIDVVNENDKLGQIGNLMAPIIERNCIVPISKSDGFCTVKNNQKEIEVNIYQGEHRLAKENIFLGTISVHVPPNKAGKEIIDVRFSYDLNGLLEIDITVLSTGRTYNKVIVNSDSLTPQQIKASRDNLAKLKFHPRDQEANKLLMSRAEKLYECSVAERREYIADIISQFESVLEKQNTREIEEVRQRFAQLIEEIENESYFT